MIRALACAALASVSAADRPKLPMTVGAAEENPLLAEWTTPYGVPPYDLIRREHFVPALKAALAGHAKEVDAIVANPEAPTFANTCAALERAQAPVTRVNAVFENYMLNERTDAIDAVQSEMTPLLVRHEADIVAKTQLFARVSAVYRGDQTGLSTEEKRILRDLYLGFRRSGAELPAPQLKRLKEINLALGDLSQRFSRNVLGEDRRFKDAFGRSIAEFKQLMASTADRGLRRRMFEFYTGRCNHDDAFDNRRIAVEMLKLRHEKAKMLGYANSAEFFIEPRMAKSADEALRFLEEIAKASTAKMRLERADMQRIMDRDIAAGLVPAGGKIEPWDWWHYAERLRKERYAVDDASLRRYFRLEDVMRGMFRGAERLYGVRFEEMKGLPSYNPKETRWYRLVEADGSLVGVIVFDMRARLSKASGAWKSEIRQQYVDENGRDVRPIVTNCANMGDRLTSRDVETLFHELGHALQNLMQHCRYRASGFLNSDYVEVFSQFNEHYAFQPELLAEYAKDDDGNAIPAELVARLAASGRHNQGFIITELAVTSLLDLRLHLLTDFENLDVEAFEKRVCAEAGLVDGAGLRYRTAYFKHVFAGEYSAGYYSYLWARVLEQDLYSLFEKSGDVWNRDLADRFRRTFFANGNAEDPMTLFKAFAGRAPDNSAFFEAKGLRALPASSHD